MLAGAGDTLRNYSPKIAICTYHLADDPLVIANLLRNADARYQLISRWKKMYGVVPSKR